MPNTTHQEDQAKAEEAKNLGALRTKVFRKENNRNGSHHLLRRLARIDLDTGSTWLDRFIAGEFPSVAATARAAGIPVGRVVKLGDPLTAACAIVDTMGKNYAQELADWLLSIAQDSE